MGSSKGNNGREAERWKGSCWEVDGGSIQRRQGQRLLSKSYLLLSAGSFHEEV